MLISPNLPSGKRFSNLSVTQKLKQKNQEISEYLQKTEDDCCVRAYAYEIYIENGLFDISSEKRISFIGFVTKDKQSGI